MTPYSLDLRRKVVQAYERGMGSQRQIAEFFDVSLGFVEKLLAQWRSSGQLAPKPHGGGKPSRLDESVQQQLARWVQGQPDLTLAELAERLERERGIRVGAAYLCRVLQKMALPRKKSRSMPASASRRR